MEPTNECYVKVFILICIKIFFIFLYDLPLKRFQYKRKLIIIKQNEEIFNIKIKILYIPVLFISRFHILILQSHFFFHSSKVDGYSPESEVEIVELNQYQTQN